MGAGWSLGKDDRASAEKEANERLLPAGQGVRLADGVQ